MCIAILCPKGKQITAQQFRNSWDNNFHGAGFMYNDDNDKLHVVKEMEDCDKIYKKYVAAVNKYPNATFVLHFRISNRGVISRENCHPFKVSNKLGFVHNGTITPMGSDERFSDTHLFNTQILRKLPQVDIKYLSNKAIKAVLGDFVGYSKLVFLDNKGNATIINEHNGTWEKDGIWYSNDSHKRVKNDVDMGGKLVPRSQLSNSSGSGWNNSSRFRWDGQRTIGYESRYYDESSKDYGRLNGSTLDLHSADDKTIGDIKASVGKVHTKSSVTPSNYSVSDGGKTCKTCGAHTVEGELMSEDGECMECVSQEEAIAIASAAVEDGAVLEYYTDGSIVVDDFEDDFEEDEDEIVECDGCLEVHYQSDLTKVEEWNTCLCPNCLSSCVEQGFIDKDKYGVKEVKETDPLVLLYGDDE